jgi:hypothetical protein
MLPTCRIAEPFANNHRKIIQTLYISPTQIGEMGHDLSLERKEFHPLGGVEPKGKQEGRPGLGPKFLPGSYDRAGWGGGG